MTRITRLGGRGVGLNLRTDVPRPAPPPALRDRETVSAAELADTALADKSIEDAPVRATFVSRFLVRLDHMALRGHVERVGSGQGVRWRLASDA